MTQALRDALDAATEARVAKDVLLDQLAEQHDRTALELARLEAVLAEVAFERDELTKAEDAAWEAFTAAGGQLDFYQNESRYFEPAEVWG